MRLKLVRLFMVIPVVHMRSRVCPFLWVGKSTCCVMLNEFRISKNSVAVVQEEESTCRLKSPNRRTEGEMAQSWVRNSEISERNVVLGLGGR